MTDTVNKDKFDSVLQKLINSKPLPYKELIEKSPKPSHKRKETPKS